MSQHSLADVDKALGELSKWYQLGRVDEDHGHDLLDQFKKIATAVFYNGEDVNFHAVYHARQNWGGRIGINDRTVSLHLPQAEPIYGTRTIQLKPPYLPLSDDD